MRPISAAGFTRPPFVGICVIEMSFTRSSIMSSKARVSTSPAFVDGIVLDNGTGPPGDLKIGNVVGRVFGFRRQNTVALFYRQRIERHIPGDRRILHQRNFFDFGVN